MLTLTIPEEQLQAAMTVALEQIFKADNYNNPIKKLIENAVGSTYSKGTLTPQIEEKITAKLNVFMETPEFDTMLGQACAKAIADREISKIKK